MHTRRPSRSLAAPWAVAAMVLALAACGSGGGGSDDVASLGRDDDSSGDDTTDTTLDPEDAAVEYAACMREHGIDMPDPEISDDGRLQVAIRARTGGGSGSAGDPRSDEFKEAEEECGPILRNALGDADPPSPEEQAEMRDNMLAFAKCMREHGVDMPDPDFGDNGMVMIGGKDDAFDPEDETFRAAEEACQDELGDMGSRRELSGATGADK